MKKTARLFIGAALGAVLTFVGASGCDDNETLFTGDNCEEACGRYQACYNASFDVTACTNRCETALNDNTSGVTVQTTDACLECIGENSCLSATYNCAAVCDLFIVVD
jgi:hypothetical protein